jgi:hypothetical protein
MVTTTRNLLTASWKEGVQALESALARFTLDRPLPNDCEVAFFEILGDDGHLHVNVTHKHETTAPRGWAGPGLLPEGFVHNRRFGNARRSEVTRHIRDMVFADRIDLTA